MRGKKKKQGNLIIIKIIVKTICKYVNHTNPALLAIE